MKKLVLIVSAFLLVIPIHAQRNHSVQTLDSSLSSEAIGKEERIIKDLNLSPEQTSKWKTASEARKQANKPIKEKLKGCTTPDERKQLHNQMHSNIQQFDNEVNAFLNAEQKTKFEKLLNLRRFIKYYLKMLVLLIQAIITIK